MSLIINFVERIDTAVFFKGLEAKEDAPGNQKNLLLHLKQRWLCVRNWYEICLLKLECNSKI